MHVKKHEAHGATPSAPARRRGAAAAHGRRTRCRTEPLCPVLRQEAILLILGRSHQH